MAAAAAAACIEAVGQRLDTRPRRVTRLRPGTALMMTFPRSCGGDMSTPQKYPPTRHSR
jgi:hypothetical protein